MCGIAGICAFRGSIRSTEIREMTRALRHRGPDDEGYLFANTVSGVHDEKGGEDTVDSLKSVLEPVRNAADDRYNLVFGHRRLSIIDLSHLGHQPMAYDNGSFWIVYNGEIFNYVELRKELRDAGYQFATHSDTEVILASYAHWGAECVTHFNGDWSFCIYDRRNGTLFASRDRYGVRSLYYYMSRDVFAFASEIKALFCLPGVSKSVNPRQMSNFIVFGLIDYTDETKYNDIHQLKPANNLILHLSTGKLQVHEYYRVNANMELGSYGQGEAGMIARNVADLLTDSVRLRLRSDVQVGSCLSGGLDSSSIVMIINGLMRDSGIPVESVGEHQKTFTACYPNDPIDESAYAKDIIERADVDGRFVLPDGKRLWQELDNLLYHQDEPFGSTTIYAQWNVMRLASEHVKVVLDGQGGDELFGGYGTYPSYAMSQGHYRLVLDRLKLYGPAAIGELVYGLGFRFTPAWLRETAFKVLRRKYLRFFPLVLPELSGDKESLSSVKETILDVVKPNLNLRLWQDFTKYSIPQLLHYEDRNGMAFSVESRVPFLDYRLVDYVMSVPAIYKIRNGWSKWVLRLAMKDILPENVLWRKDKLGFTTPERKWLLDGENPFTSFVREHSIPYDGDYYWWRLFIADYWLKKMRGGGV